MSEINQFENELKKGSQLLSKGDLAGAAVKHHRFMREIIEFLTQKYAPEVYKKASKYGHWGYWREEQRYGYDIAYHIIRTELEQQGGEDLSLSLALAWKSAREIQEEMRYHFHGSDEELISEDIDNIRRFWYKIKDFIKE